MAKKFCNECGEKFEYLKKEKVNTCPDCRGEVIAKSNPPQRRQREERVRPTSDYSDQHDDGEIEAFLDVDEDELKESLMKDAQRIQVSAAQKHTIGDVIATKESSVQRSRRRPSANRSASDILSSTKSDKSYFEVDK